MTSTKTLITEVNMADYTTLKAAIASVIKTNGNQEITGLLLQQTLHSMLDGVNTTKQDTINFVINTANKFLRDDGTFQEIPTPTGSFTNNVYLSSLPSDIATYKILSYEPDSSEEITTNSISASEGNKLVATYLYPVGVDTNLVPAGLWSFIFNSYVSSTVGNTNIGVQCFARAINGSETTLFTVWSETIGSTSIKETKINYSGQTYNVNTSDRIGIRVLLRTTSVPSLNVSFIVGDGRGSYFNTPISIRHKQIRSLNEDPNYQHITQTEKTNFQTAFIDRFKWDGGSSGLNAVTGRESLGLRIGIDVLAYRTFGSAASNNTNDFLAYNGVAVDSSKLGGQLPSYYQTNITAGTSLQYYRGDKTMQTLDTSVVPENSNMYFTYPRVLATALTGYVAGANTALSATDTLLDAMGKIQGQINARALASDLSGHINNTTIHLTADEKAYLGKIMTYLKVAVDNTSMYSTINFYSESGVSAYGIGTGGGGGAGVDIIDNLLSVRADAALSANQGRILKGYIDLKQPQLNGTGLVRMSGTGVTYDNNSYATVSQLSGYATTSSLSNYLGKYETYAMNKYVLESIPRNTTQVGNFGWTDYQTTPYAGGGFLTLNLGSSLRSLLMIFPDYSNNDNIKVLTSIDGAPWGQQKEIAWKDHNHNGTYALLAGSTSQAFSASTITASEGYVINSNLNYEAYNNSDLGGLSIKTHYSLYDFTRIYAFGTYANRVYPDLRFRVGNVMALSIDGYDRAATFTSSVSATSFIENGVSISNKYLQVSPDNQSPRSGNFAIGSYNGRNFIQSHSGQPLDINPLGNAVTINGNVPLTSGNYSSYALPLSGGRLSGNSGEMLRINSTVSSGHWINLEVNNVITAKLGTYSVAGGYTYLSKEDTRSEIRVYADKVTYTPDYSGGNNYTLIHSGNIGSQSVNYATSAGNSSTTSQRTFDALLLGARTGYGNNSAPYYDNLIYSNVYPLYELQMGNSGQSDYATYLRFRVNARGVPDTLINVLTLAPDYATFNSEVRATSFVSNGYAVWHSGNLTNTLSNGYLPYWSTTNGKFENSKLTTDGTSTYINSGGLNVIGEVRSYTNPEYYAFIRGQYSGDSAFSLGISGHNLLTSGDDYYFGQKLHLWTSDVRRLSIIANGNVGIRNTTPNASLHIGSGTGGLHYYGGTDGTMLIHGVGGNRSQLELLSPDSSMRMILQTVQGYAHNMGFSNGHLFIDLTAGYNMSVGFGADQGYKLAVNGSGYFGGTFKAEATTAGGTAMAIFIQNSQTTYNWGQLTLAPLLSANQHITNLIGVAGSSKNVAYMGFTYAGNGSNSNKMTFGFHSADHLLTMTPLGELDLAGRFKATSYIESTSVYLTSATPIYFYGIGSGTYTRSVLYNNALEFTLEAPWTSDSSGTRVPIYFTWRGGYDAMGGIKIDRHNGLTTFNQMAIKANSIKIGANWEAIPNGSNELELRYGGVMKAKLSSSGDILAVGGVTAFAV